MLQNLSQQHQRSSSPPNFQNLHMIREDAADMLDNSMEDQEEEGSLRKTTTTTTSSTLSQDEQEQRQRQFARNPQISITDTQGHVTDVSTSDTETEPDMSVVPQSDPPTSSSPNPTTSTSAGTHVTFQHSRDSQFAPTVPQQITQHYPHLYTFPHYIGTNLTNIGPIPRRNNDDPIVEGPFYGPYLSKAGLTPLGMFGIQLNTTVSNRLHRVNQVSQPRQQILNNSNEALQQTHSVRAVSAGNFHGKLQGGSYSPTQNTQSGAATELELQEALNKINNYMWPEAYSMSPQSATPPSSLDIQPLADTKKIPSFINLTSRRNVPELLSEVKRALDDKGSELVYQHSQNLFRLENSAVQMEMEVREGGPVNGLQVRRISGDSLQYGKLCSELLAGIQL